MQSLLWTFAMNSVAFFFSLISVRLSAPLPRAHFAPRLLHLPPPDSPSSSLCFLLHFCSLIIPTLHFSVSASPLTGVHSVQFGKSPLFARLVCRGFVAIGYNAKWFIELSLIRHIIMRYFQIIIYCSMFLFRYCFNALASYSFDWTSKKIFIAFTNIPNFSWSTFASLKWRDFRQKYVEYNHNCLSSI